MQLDLLFRAARVRSGATLGIVAVLLFLLNLGLRFPGAMTPDSITQFEQAVIGTYTDRYPPITAVIWSWLRVFGDGPAPLLAFNLAGHWLGFGLLADACRRSDRTGTAWLLLLSGASPLFLYYNGITYADVSLASALTAAFGTLFWFKYQNAPLTPLAVGFVAVCLVYAALVRANGVFAVGAVVIYAIAQSWSPVKTICAAFVGTLALALLAIPGSHLINRSVFRATPSGIQQSLQLYDVVGIAAHANDRRIIPAGLDLGNAALRDCYTPLYWDPLTMGVCANLYGQLPAPGTAARQHFGRIWLASILSHPVAYIAHRLKHMNAEINFAVPALQCRFGAFDQSCGRSDPVTGRTVEDDVSRALIRTDYIKKNPFVWPITWITFGLSLLLVLQRASRGTEPRSTTMTLASALLASGIIYAAFFLVVGVATNIRYFYWTIMAVQTAAVLTLGDPQVVGRRDRWSYLLLLGPVVLVTAIGYTFRLADIDVFVR